MLPTACASGKVGHRRTITVERGTEGEHKDDGTEVDGHDA